MLEEHNPGDREDIHAVYLGQRAPLPTRVRAFIDFLSDHIQVADAKLVRNDGEAWTLADISNVA